MSNSLTPDAYAKVFNKDMQFLIEVSDKTITDGPCFLKAVIDAAYTNTRSSSVVIRAMLTSLDDYMKTLKDSNIETFNQHVKDNLKKLASAGESSNDLLMNLFKAYQCAKKNNSLLGSTSRDRCGMKVPSSLIQMGINLCSSQRAITRMLHLGVNG